MGEIYEQQGRYDEAWKEWVRFDAKALLEEMPPGSGRKGYWEARLRTEERAKEATPSRLSIPAVHLGLDDREGAIKALQALFAEHSDTMAWFVRYPRMDPLRSDPRYLDMMRQMNLEP